ncbi:MFS transporter [Cupriavidus basilensis]|uniref:Nitrate/nitrite transporter n=1 Tax=Cupriavidus basilensis TaxID=68895 RepID=A0A0C4YLD8_9BURK|nr:MFS transporter [Cupriavidus basilensis]AJG22834.1 Nitrate/nitrite transporter [Cupriavidus basilensis]
MTVVKNAATLGDAVEAPRVESALDAAAFAKVTRRIVPFIVLCYFFSYLDRVNVGFAKLQMQQALGLSDVVYGIGAGIFFWGYMLCQVPSSLLIYRLGMRKSMAAIMIMWGLVSAATMLVSTPAEFYFARFMLGVTEAGFFPAAVMYLNKWYPAARQSKIMSILFLAMPLGMVLGGPISGALMSGTHDLHGLQGWQWMFLIEALPAIVLGLLVLRMLPESPQTAPWLTREEAAAITTTLSTENARKNTSFVAALKSPVLWMLMGICLLFNIGNYGLVFWLPTIIQSTGMQSPLEIALLTAIPYGVACVVMNRNAAHAQRVGERRLHAAVPLFVAAAAMWASTLFAHNTVMAMVFLTIGISGLMATLAMFWGLPGRVLAGTAAAGGIAMINSAASLAGLIGPVLMGGIKQSTGSISLGVLALAAMMLIAAVLILAIPRALMSDRQV